MTSRNKMYCADLDDLECLTKLAFCVAMCQFITEVCKLDGTKFPPCTTYEIVICIQMFLE